MWWKLFDGYFRTAGAAPFEMPLLLSPIPVPPFSAVILFFPALFSFPFLRCPSLPYSLTVGSYRWCFWGLWMGSGQVGRGGGSKGGPDNNVTIRPGPPRPAGPWRRVKVNNGPPLRGSVGVDGEEENGVYRGRWGGVSLPGSFCKLLLGWGWSTCLWECVHTGWLLRGKEVTR